MENISGDSEGDEEHVPTFTPELALLKGEKMEADDDEPMEDDDEDMDADGLKED